MIFSKTIQLSFLAIMAFFGPSIKAQVLNNDTVYWANGNISLLSELGKVWIFVKKGNHIKEVKIHEIKKDKGVLVYEKEKCLHDLYIYNIKKIQAGKYSAYPMYFHPDNTPYIKQDEFKMDPLLEWKEFSYYTLERPAMNPKPEEAGPYAFAPHEKFIIENDTATTFNDTIIDQDGHVLLTRIVEINKGWIKFKKQGIPDGPYYVISGAGSQVTKTTKGMLVNFSKIKNPK